MDAGIVAGVVVAAAGPRREPGRASRPPRCWTGPDGPARSEAPTPTSRCSRAAGLGRAAVDAAVAALDVHELPSARGCTYVVPATDFALALIVGQAFGGGEMNVARKLGVDRQGRRQAVRQGARGAGEGPLDPEGTEGGRRACREEPRRGGQEEGAHVDAAAGPRPAAAVGRHPPRARRRPPRSAALQVRPVEAESRSRDAKMSAEEAYVELARRFFQWIGPARPADFQWFSGLGVKAAKAAIESARPRAGRGRQRPPRRRGRDLDAFTRMKAPGKPQYALVGIHRQPQPAAARPAEPARPGRPEAGRGGRARRPRTRRPWRPAEPRDPRPRPAGRPLGVRPRRAADRLVGVRRGPEGQGARRGRRADGGVRRRRSRRRAVVQPRQPEEPRARGSQRCRKAAGASAGLNSGY